MNKKRMLTKTLAVFLALLLGFSPGVMAQSGSGEAAPLKQEELDQLLAPIALYPDSLLAQILMASTYPLEVAQAGRWAEANQNLDGDALTTALEKEEWDPSVKSLVNFPQVLNMMNAKLDWTQKLGDAFLAHQKEVLDTVQKLRAKAEAEGNLKSNEQQTVVVEKETQTIIIEPASPEVVYVPTYNPTVVYGAWWYPSYPPYYYYPPGYTAGAALFTFGVGVAIGAAWGYAWGGCNWRGGDVNIDIDRNTNINNNIDRSKHRDKVSTGEGGKGSWKHNPEHRKGVSYRDQNTAQKNNRGASRDAKSRDEFRGRAESGRQDIARGGADEFRGRSGSDRPSAGTSDRGSTHQGRDSGRMDQAGSRQGTDRSAFSGMDKGGGATRDSSYRGHQSLSSSRGGGGGASMSRPSGGARGGGGRGGGRR